MSELIKPAHREAIKQVAAAGSSAALRRRAALLLHYEAGHATAAVAEHVGLSISSVLRWRRLYREQGMGIFPTVNHSALPVSESVHPDAAQEAVKEKPKTKKQGGKGKKRRKQMKKDKKKKGKGKKEKKLKKGKLKKLKMLKKRKKQKKGKAKKTGKKKK